jgi:hypothetical protein
MSHQKSGSKVRGTLEQKRDEGGDGLMVSRRWRQRRVRQHAQVASASCVQGGGQAAAASCVQDAASCVQEAVASCIQTVASSIQEPLRYGIRGLG